MDNNTSDDMPPNPEPFQSLTPPNSEPFQSLTPPTPEPSQPLAPYQPTPEPQPATPYQPVPQPKKNVLLLLIPVLVVVIVAAVLITLFFVNQNGDKNSGDNPTPTSDSHPVSIDDVRNYCLDHDLTIEEDSDIALKANIIECNSKTTRISSDGAVESIRYLVLNDDSVRTFDAYYSFLWSGVNEGGIVLEDTDEFKKYYFSTIAETKAFLIVEDKAYIFIYGDEDAIRTALIKIGYPDRNWPSEEEHRTTSHQQTAQRDALRASDMLRLETSLVMYQTNHSSSPINLPIGPSYWQGAASFDDSCNTNTSCSFVRDYMNATSNTSSTNGFEDPDGTPYSMYITENLVINGSITTSYEDAKLNGDPTNGYTVGTDFDKHIVYIIPGGMCDGEKVVKSTKRHFAVMYQLEISSTYCMDDQ